MASRFCFFAFALILLALAITPLNSAEVFAGFTPTFTPIPTFTPVPPTPTPVPPPPAPTPLPPTPTPTLAPLLPVTGGSFGFVPGLIIFSGLIAFVAGILGLLRKNFRA
jgi:hypothetical protein